jgi:hypothetical protein
MRANLAAAVSGLIGIGLIAASTAPANAEAIKITPELTVFSAEETTTSSDRPTILRGSATRRGAVPFDDIAPIQIGAGSTLWMADPLTGEVVACEPRRTSRVGGRYVDCVVGQSPY